MVANVHDFVVADKLPKRELGHSNSEPATQGDDGEPLFHIQDSSMDESMDSDLNPPKPGSGDVNQAATENEPQTGPPLLRTKLAVNQDAQIFASYVRDFASIETRFNDKNQYSVVMAPSDSAIERLGAKPWEFPERVDPGLSPEEKDRLARKNIKSFITNHIHYGDFDGAVSILGQKEPEYFDITTEAGTTIKVEPSDDKLKLTTSDGVVATVEKAEKVDNGAIWILDNSLVSP